jgi:hypothetical protein
MRCFGRGLALALVAMACFVAVNGVKAGEVGLTATAKGIDVTIDGAPFTTFSASKEYAKPFFLPVRAADGTAVTRVLDNPEDHPHHKGVWFSLDEVNGLNFWAEKARIETQSFEVVKGKGNPAVLKYVAHWLGDDGQPLLEEATEVRIFDNRMFAFSFELKAVSKAVHFEDTKEGLFGIRLPNGMREKETGKVVNAEGLKSTKECWGKESPWVDYYGELGGKTYGVTLFDHPENFRKSRYHVRDYGLFSMSPFGPNTYSNGKEPEAPVTLQPGEKVRLRYGLYVHTGTTEEGRVAETYKGYLEGSK